MKSINIPHIHKKTRIIGILLLSVYSLLIIARLILPVIVKNYVNKVLSNMEGYRGSIDDVDIRLIRGAYVIKNLTLEKVNEKVPVPFITAKTVDLSIEWKTLLKGTIKGKVVFDDANLNFVFGPDSSSNQYGAETNWTVQLKKLLPIQIDRFEIHNSKVSCLNFHSKPKIDMKITHVNVWATNLSNLDNPGDELPSILHVEGISIGEGKLSITGKMNVLKKIPNACIKLKLTNVHLPSLNNLFKAFGKFEFEKGTFSLYSELSLDNSNIQGYIKPILNDMNVKNWSDENGNAFQKLWVVVVGVAFDVFKNQTQNEFATKIPIKGTLSNVDPEIINGIINIFHNAFIKAYDKSFDNTVTFGPNKEIKDKSIFDIFKKKSDDPFKKS